MNVISPVADFTLVGSFPRVDPLVNFEIWWPQERLSTGLADIWTIGSVQLFMFSQGSYLPKRSLTNFTFIRAGTCCGREANSILLVCTILIHGWKKVKTERNSVEKESFIFFNKFLHALSWLCPFQRTNEHLISTSKKIQKLLDLKLINKINT